MNAVAGPPNLLAGRYQLERILGTGGMGVVYRARDLMHEAFGEPDCRVALKLLGETLSASADAHVLLYSEFALTRSLRHDHVVRAFSFEVDTMHQLAFFTMEVMPGLTLDRMLPECPQGLAWQELQPMALQLLDALAYTHRQGVLHGDVKPANIMVGEQGLRLFDFGLGHGEAQAKAGLPSLSRSRLNAWTPAYAAPELIAGGGRRPVRICTGLPACSMSWPKAGVSASASRISDCIGPGNCPGTAGLRCVQHWRWTPSSER